MSSKTVSISAQRGGAKRQSQGGVREAGSVEPYATSHKVMLPWCSTGHGCSQLARDTYLGSLVTIHRLELDLPTITVNFSSAPCPPRPATQQSKAIQVLRSSWYQAAVLFKEGLFDLGLCELAGKVLNMRDVPSKIDYSVRHHHAPSPHEPHDRRNQLTLCPLKPIERSPHDLSGPRPVGNVVQVAPESGTSWLMVGGKAAGLHFTQNTASNAPAAPSRRPSSTWWS